MNPEPTTILTSQRPCSRRASDRAEDTPPLSAQSASLDTPPFSPSSNKPTRDLETATQARRQLNEAHSIPGESESGEGIVRASLNINAEYHVDSDQIAAITTKKSSSISHLGAIGDPTISSVSTSISLEAQDVLAVSSNDLTSFFESTRRPSISDSPSSAHSLKHPRSPLSLEPPLKKRRPELKRRHTLGPELFLEGFDTQFDPRSSTLPSPEQQNQALPPRPPTSHAITAIRNKVREDSGGITTLGGTRESIGNDIAQSWDNIPGHSISMEDRSSMSLDPETRSTLIQPELLANVGIVELLDQDERPTFIIDVADPENYTPGGPLQIIFANASLRAYGSILDVITSTADLDLPGVHFTNALHAFKAWALSFVKNNESLNVSLPSYLFEGLSWTCSTLQKRLRVIYCTNINIINSARPGSSNGGLSNLSPFGGTAGQLQSLSALSHLAMGPSETSDYFGEPGKASLTDVSPLHPRSSPDPGDSGLSPLRKQPMLVAPNEGDAATPRHPVSSSFDWTRIPMSAALPRHIQFARSVDWAATPLGPIENWTFDLRAMCNLVMGSPHPAAMFWGPEYVSIYNEAYIHLAGQKHPSMMGQSYNLAWAEIWAGVEDAFSNAMQSGQATMKDDDCLFLKRDGQLEETYFSWSIIPLVGDDGSVVGIYNPAFDKTRRKIAERRMLTLREIGERTAAARDLKGFWSQVIKGLEFNEYDVPFMLLYSVCSDAGQCTLEGSLGVPQGHRSAESPLNLQTSDGGFAPYLRESMKSKGAVLLTTEYGTLSYDLIKGLEWRGWGDPCRAVVVLPIHPTTGDSIVGFLVMGVNPRRPYDDEYSLFIQLLSRQLATSMASVMLFEEEIRRGQLAARLADVERQELSRQLDLRTQEAVESETKFTRMAEFAPVGMFIAKLSGEISYSNDAWWEISRHPKEYKADTWMESIHDEDREGVLTIWNKLVEERAPVTHEFRFKTAWQDRNGNRGDTWVLMSAYPERDENEQLKSVFGSITNISQQKWAEDFQKRRMEEAFESKRQQDNFIDMTSHEMRNPLSAILQSADEIGMSLSEFLSSLDESSAPGKLADLLDSSVEAAQTISLCAQHQKRIVDDILTLSKLDSALLIVTPVAVQPVAVVQRALRMFEGELDSNDIALEFRVQKTYLDMDIDWVKLDPSRLLQVLINLTTNAIKFTSGQDKRTIVVSIGASSVRPNTDEADVSYFPSRLQHKDLTADEIEWGRGENIYLQFAVQDTGRGLDESEKTLLFQRFRQASPRTHVQYGGSGLGLFISRELTELQGGEIGVASERGIGSTFAFYVKARRAEDMPKETPIAAVVNSLRRASSITNATSFTVENRRNAAGMPVYRSNTKGRVRRSSAIASPSVPSTSTLDYSKLKALIVEDNLVNQRVLQKQLRNIGFDAEVANHGGEALETLKTSRFWVGREKDGIELAIVLMDLEMPVMDGLTCARTIRNLERAGSIVKHVPIIAVTANVRLEQIEMAISAGMDDVVSKPFRIPELLPKIEDLISRNATASWTVPPVNNTPPSNSPP